MGLWNKLKKAEKKTSEGTSNQNNNITDTPTLLIVLKLPVFSGSKNESLHKFLQQINESTNNHSEDQKLHIILHHLRGNAANLILQNISTTSQLTCSHILDLLQQHFSEPDVNVINNLQIKQQRDDESIQTYATYIKRTINKKLPNNKGFKPCDRELQMQQQFLNGFSPTTKTALKEVKFKSFKDAVQHTIFFEQQRDQTPREERQGLSLL